MSSTVDTQQDLHTAAREFAVGLAQSKEYHEYEAAKDAVKNDQEALNLLQRFQRAQQQAQQAASWGGNQGSSTDDLETLKGQVIAHPVLTRYFTSQEALIRMLKETNEYMKQHLGFDFANTAKPSQGCC